jgi:hypothetical protein
MSKIKLVYQKEFLNIKRTGSSWFDYSYDVISDTTIPNKLAEYGINVIKQKHYPWDYNVVKMKLQSKDSKQNLKNKVMFILNKYFADKISIGYLK